MGFLRVLLAIAVVLDHLGGLFRYKITGGVVAVQLFFVISGFYMAMVLSEKYNPISGKKNFWISRGMRIYVTYFSALVLVLCLEGGAYFIARHGFFQYWHSHGDFLSGIQKVLMGVSVFTIFGQDAWVYFRLGIDNLSVNLQGPPDVNLVYMLPMPQAWSVSLELMFYALAPFLIRLSTSKLIILALAALALRCISNFAGYGNDPWSYRFFPFELTLFLMGMLSFRLSGFFAKKMPAPKYVSLALIALCLLVQPIVALTRSVGLDDVVPHFVIYIYAMLALPALFAITKDNGLDKIVSEFSYPIYLVHFSVIHLVDAIFQSHGLSNLSLRVLVVLVTTLALSYLLIVAVERPIDNLRKKRNVRALSAGLVSK